MTGSLFTCALVAAGLLAAADLPIGGFSHAGFRIADLQKTRAFYTGALGFEQAFEQKDAAGTTTLAVFKINEDQFLEFSPGKGTGDRLSHIAFLAGKLEQLRTLIGNLGLNPPELRTGRDRTRNFSIRDPDGHRVEFVRYEPDSMHAQARGKFAGPRRISTRLLAVGLPVADEAKAKPFFQTTLGIPARAIEFLAPGAPSHLTFEAADPKRAGTVLIDPDGTPIHLVNN